MKFDDYNEYDLRHSTHYLLRKITIIKTKYYAIIKFKKLKKNDWFCFPKRKKKKKYSAKIKKNKQEKKKY